MIPWIFLILTLSFLIYIIFISFRELFKNLRKGSWGECKGRISIKTELVKNVKGKEVESKSAFIIYEVDGRKYRKPINFYSITLKPGKYVKVYYDPENPESHKLPLVFHRLFLIGIFILFLMLLSLVIRHIKG